ncbi:MAG TPA: hypothetical protein PKD90_00410 [Phnomibacter sp.]|nr:hypothetical protein [Phnomibacter sp.]
MHTHIKFRLQGLVFLMITPSLGTIAQRVGVGTIAPRASLHVQVADSNLLTLNNSNVLMANAKSTLWLRTGPWYTGALKTIGTSTNTARLGLFTYAVQDSTLMEERLSILDNGRVGIGNPNPVANLDVTGNGRFTSVNLNGAAVTGHNTGQTFLNAGVIGRAEAAGVVGEATWLNGVGVAGVNVLGNAYNAYFAGTGVYGYSNQGHGVVGITGRLGYAGVYGTPRVNQGLGGLFVSGAADGYTNTLALRTIGPIRLSSIGEANGRVLTSDANGNATWQAVAANPKGFSARLNTAVTLVSDTEFTLGNMTEIFDEGNIFTNGSNSFTAPETGLYQVTFNAFISQVNATFPITFDSYFSIDGGFNNNSLTSSTIVGTSSSTTVFTHTNTRLLRLVQGEVLTVRCSAGFINGTLTLRAGNFGGSTVLSIHQVK